MAAERVALGDEAARRVDDDAAAVGDVAGAHHLVGAAGVGEPQRVERHHLVGREAVVQLDHLHVARADAGLGQARRRPRAVSCGSRPGRWR